MICCTSILSVRFNSSDWSFCPVINTFSKSGKKKKFSTVLKGEKLPNLENLMM